MTRSKFFTKIETIDPVVVRTVLKRYENYGELLN